MIPKVIHYCWFGNNPLPPVVKACMESWKKYCPDYQIIEWNESNFDVHACRYTEEAYQAKKWAFVSDYARIKVLYEYGGIYMDTDVELLKNIDPLLSDKAFMGFESGLGVASGLITGAEADLPIFKELLDEYSHYVFKKGDGSYNMTSCVDYTTALLEKYGLIRKDRLQCIEEIKVYPIAYFCPLNHSTGEIHVKKETYSIHRYEGTWATETVRYGYKLKWKYISTYGKHVGKVLYLFPYTVYIIKHDGFRALVIKTMEKFKSHI